MSNDKVLVFLKANLGIASLLSLAMQEEGATKEEADSKMWLVDSKGLLVKVTLPPPPPPSHAIIRSESLIIQTLKCTALLEKSVIFLHKMFHVNC